MLKMLISSIEHPGYSEELRVAAFYISNYSGCKDLQGFWPNMGQPHWMLMKPVWKVFPSGW